MCLCVQYLTAQQIKLTPVYPRTAQHCTNRYYIIIIIIIKAAKLETGLGPVSHCNFGG